MEEERKGREWGRRSEPDTSFGKVSVDEGPGAELVGEPKVEVTRLAVFEIVGIPIHLRQRRKNLSVVVGRRFQREVCRRFCRQIGFQ